MAWPLRGLEGVEGCYATGIVCGRGTSTGVGGKPTVVFSGANVQIIDGSGATSTVNGTGDLVLGYDETPGGRPGSHDLILGEHNALSSYSELVDGYNDTASGDYAVAVGENDTASGGFAAVLGANNHASGAYSLAAGDEDTASGEVSSVLGGLNNTARGGYSVAAGGCSNLAGRGKKRVVKACHNRKSYARDFATVAGGSGNRAGAIDAWSGGGCEKGFICAVLSSP